MEMLPISKCGIICAQSNCGKTNVLISLLESPYGVRFENVYVLEIPAITEISILEDFTDVDRKKSVSLHTSVTTYPRNKSNQFDSRPNS